jgi:hypothetical protein
MVHPGSGMRHKHPNSMSATPVIGWNLVSPLLRSRSFIPREVLRPAVAANAYAIVLAHNHPSGNPNPSLADHDTTRTIQTAARSSKSTSFDKRMNAIPDNVTRFVQAHLQSLRELRPSNSNSVFALEKMLGGALKAATSGRLGLKDAIQRRLRDAQEGLNLFRTLAKDNGIDPELFINSLGGEPSFSDCEQTTKQFTS